MNAISHLVRISDSPAAVFGALTNDQSIEKWFTESACDEWQTGETVTWFGDTVMTISEMTLDHSITFQVKEGSGWEGTYIRFELEPFEERTLVRFDQTGWQEITDHFRDCSMSWAYFLESLKLFVETGTGTPESHSPPCEST